MRAGEPSRTAEYMALFRALESALPEGQRLFEDDYAAGFLGGGLRRLAALARLPGGAAAISRLVDRRNPGPRASAIVRTRLIDDALLAALADGVDQVVLLGAGYDSRALRLPAAARARFFELDHPSTQVAKRRRLAAMSDRGELPSNVTWVPIDFTRQDFGSELLGAGFEAGRRAFLIWEGVTNYLDADSVAATLAWVGGSCAAGTLLSFTYVERGLLDGTRSFPGSERWVQAVESAGEPFTFGLLTEQLDDYLAGFGLELREDVNTAQALDGLASATAARIPVPPAFYHVALAAAR